MKIKSLATVLETSHPKILIYGDAGSGKTTMAGTLPGRILVASAEDGLRSLSLFPEEDRARIDVVSVATTDDLREVYAALKKGEVSYDWLVVDSVSEIAEMMLREAKSKTKDPRQAYTGVEDDVTAVFRSFRDLPLGVLFLAKEHVTKLQISEEVEVDRFGLLMPGQRLTTNVPHLVDEVWRLTVKGKGARVIITDNDGRSRAKSRHGLEREIDVSNGIADVIARLK